jgi:hypothetical protein
MAARTPPVRAAVVPFSHTGTVSREQARSESGRLAANTCGALEVDKRIAVKTR